MAIHKKILVASTNPGKLRELREMLGGEIEWVGLADFPGVPDIEEDGKTFAENARKKALGYAKATGLWTLADDSGLVVDALGGEPGVKSARFAGFLPQRRKDTKRTKSDERRIIDHKNFEKVLQLLKDVPKEKRQARFVCYLCLASPDGILAEMQGELEGFICGRPVGENGFGYDPIFFVPKLNKTVAQLTAEEKNAISHRGNAIRKLKPLIKNLLKNV
jgi:XTP/dITP diphosphohydrolase